MKRSTKLLIALLCFATVIILLHYTAVAIMVAYDINAVRKSYGDAGKYKEEHPEGVEVIDVKGFNDVRVVMGDSLFYRIYESRDKQTYFDFTHLYLLSINGFNEKYDTIYSGTGKQRTIVKIDTTTYPYDPVLELHITGKEELNIHQSSVVLMESAVPLNVRINLDNSNFNGSYYPENPIMIDRLDITAYNTSSIGLGEKMKCREVNISFLDFGSFNGSATVEKGTLRFNDSTKLNGEIYGYLLRDMKLIHQPFDSTNSTSVVKKILIEEVVDSTKPPVR